MTLGGELRRGRDSGWRAEDVVWNYSGWRARLGVALSGELRCGVALAGELRPCCGSG